MDENMMENALLGCKVRVKSVQSCKNNGENFVSFKKITPFARRLLSRRVPNGRGSERNIRNALSRRWAFGRASGIAKSTLVNKSVR